MTLPKNTIKKYLPLILLFGVSLFVVFYHFLSIPKRTTFDEIEFAKLAIQLGKQSYTPYSQLATGHATLYFYIILLSFKLFGISLFALCLSSLIFGLFNPLIFYNILKKVFNKKPSSIVYALTPLLLSLIFVTMRWYFNFARFGFEATFLLFLEFSSLFFMLHHIETKKWSPLVLSGVFAGLAYNSYQPGRIFILIPLTLLIHSFFVMKAKRITTLSYFLVPFFLLILPLSIYLNINKDTRFYQQFYPDNHEMALQEKGQFFVRNLSSTVGIFMIKGDVNGRHNYPNKPALNLILGFFFLFGLILALKQIKNKYNQFFLLWFLISLAPTLFTYPWENPNMLRTFTVLPSVVYFIGLSLQFISNIGMVKKYVPQKVLLIAIILLFSVSTVYELRTYFVHQKTVFEEAFEAERDLKSYLPMEQINEK